MGDRKVIVFDTTLRDGEQTPGVNFNKDNKYRIAKQLVSLGVDVIEAGFPAASNGDFEAVKNISENIDSAIIAGLSRCVKEDIDRTYEALKNAKKSRIHLFIATSDIHLKYKLKISRDEALKMAVDSVKYAVDKFDEVQFSAEDASRTDWDFLVKVFNEVIDVGARIINIPDTVGYAVPNEFGRLVKYVKDRTQSRDDVTISVHCHNDLGMAVVNSLTALENGADQVEVTVCGIGERAGNASLEEVIMAINTRKDYFNLLHSINTKEIFNTCKLVSELSGINLQPNKAIVGANAFRHAAGIHQHGVINNKATYEIMRPEDVGITTDHISMGKLSGRNAFEMKLKNMGYELSYDEINLAFKKFKDIADNKKIVNDDEIKAIVDDVIMNSKNIEEGEIWV